MEPIARIIVILIMMMVIYSESGTKQSRGLISMQAVSQEKYSYYTL